MKQVLQDLRSGETFLLEVPAPKRTTNQVLIATSRSLVSPGTERMLVEFGKANLLNKARSQPDKVKMVLDKVITDGVKSTYDAVNAKLNEPLPLGYCNAGSVIDSGGGAFEHGTRVVSNGFHAEVVRVGQNLVAEIPDNVDDESACFTALGAIALQGVRLVSPTIGESVVVLGLGLVGLLAVQILKANGCRVLAADYDPKRVELAASYGVEAIDLSQQELYSHASIFTRGRGADAVLVAASSKSNDVIHQACEISRKRGRVVLVGVVGLNLRRSDFYEKEITFQVSCSYGPGRYDPAYELEGRDYPIGFVRWTEQRNFEAVLDMMSSGVLDVKGLVTRRYRIDDAVSAYADLTESNALGIVLEYSRSEKTIESRAVSLSDQERSVTPGTKTLSFVGAGSYASKVLIPAFKKAGAEFSTLVTSSGTSAAFYGSKFGFEKASTDFNHALTSDALVIATRHNQHAEQVERALKSGRHVFVEKPLALTLTEIDNIEKAWRPDDSVLTVGFNRRYSPHIRKIKELTRPLTVPKTVLMTMNVGEIPEDHWVHDVEVGGGRVLGEACHYIDLMRYLVGHPIVGFNAIAMKKNSALKVTDDKAIISLSFSDGSIGCIHYLANGGSKFPKERVEVFCNDAVLQLDNFRKLRGFGWRGFSAFRTPYQNKGQQQCVEAFLKALVSGESPIPPNELIEVARVSVAVADQLRQQTSAQML